MRGPGPGGLIDRIRLAAPLLLAIAVACSGSTAPPSFTTPDVLGTCPAVSVPSSPVTLRAGTRVALPGKPHAVGVSAGGLAYVSQLDSHTVAPVNFSSFTFGHGLKVGGTPLQIALNSSATIAYVANFTPTVAVLDLSSGATITNLDFSGTATTALVGPGDSELWVATNADSAFGIENSNRFIDHRLKIGARVTGLELPTGLAFCDPFLYVSDDGGMLAAFDTRRNTLVKSWTLGGNPERVVLSADAKRLFIANQDGNLDVIDLATRAAASVPITGGGLGLARSPADGRLYVTTSRGEVQVIDPGSLAKVDSFIVGGAPRDIGFNAAGTIALVANEAGWVDFLTAAGVVTPPAPARALLDGEPWGVAVSSTGVVYVTEFGDQRVATASLPSFAFPAALAVGGTPEGVAFNSAGTRAYVASQSGSVSVIDVAAAREITKIPLGWNAYAVIVAPGDSTVWVTSDRIYGIRTSTGTITHRVPVPDQADCLAIRDSLLYASVAPFGIVLEVNTRTDSVQRTFAVGGSPQGIELSAAGDVLYIANQDSTLQFWDIARNQSLGSVVLDGPAFGLARHPVNGKVWVTTTALGRVQVVDPVSRTVVDSFAVGGDPRRIAFNADGTIAVVANRVGWVDFIQN